MSFDSRSLAVATAGFAAFVNLYSPQALLPRLGSEFHVGPGKISTLMTACTAAIAISAPFSGALADVTGRKRLITATMFAVVAPTLIMTFAGSVPSSPSGASCRG
jgi:MFS family permease